MPKQTRPNGARILPVEILQGGPISDNMRGEGVRRSNDELRVDWEAFERTLYRVATPEDLEELLSSTGPGGKFPSELGFTPEFYRASPELVTIEAKQFLTRVRRDLEDILLFTKPLITVKRESAD